MPVPHERGFFGSLNTIRMLVESTCEDKWDLLVETALPAAGHALYLLIVPDPGEILENYLQPRGHRGDPKRAKAGHGRRQMTRFGQMRWWQKIGFPDVDSIIAEHLPGRDLFEGRSAGAPERWFWKGIDVIDRGLWYWMLLDLSQNFVVEWASGIMESRFCTSPFNALFTATGHTQPLGTSNVLWSSPSELTVETNHGWKVSTGGSLIRENSLITVSGHLAVSLTARIPDSEDTVPTEVGMQVTFLRRSTVVAQVKSTPKEYEQGETIEAAASAHVEGFTRVHLQLYTVPGKPSYPLENPDWILSFFGDPD